MINTYKYNSETWIDIDNGTEAEIYKITEEYNIHPFVANELNTKTPKSRVELHNGYIYCILHFPVWKHTHSKDNKQEIDFIVGTDLLITARYDTIDAIHKFSKSLEVNEILRKNSNNDAGALLIFTAMLRYLYGSLFDELDYIEDTIESVTDSIFKEKEREMVVSISELTRTLLNFKQTLDFHHEILQSLIHYGKKLFGEKFSGEMELIVSDYIKINTAIKSHLERLHELRDTNNSLLSTKQNETVKKLTVVGSIVLPLNLIAVIFAMRTEGMPLITNPNAFWIVVIIMITSVLITLTYAKHKHLL